MAINLPNVGYPYIKISFKGGESVIWKGTAPDYFTSLSHKRIVQGANELTLNLKYVPQIGESPNKIENALVNSRGEIFIQYGHAGGATRYYKAMIYNYSIDINEGALDYTLNGISKAVSFNWTHFSMPTQLNTREEVIKFMKDCVDHCLWNDEVAYKFDENNIPEFSIPKLGVTVASDGGPIKAIQNVASQLYIEKRKRGTKKTFADFKKANPYLNIRTLQQEYADYLRDYNSTPDSTKDENYFFTIEIDDGYTFNQPGIIKLILVDSKQTEANYSFEWGSKQGDILSWKPEYQGTYAIYGESTYSDTQSLVDPTNGTVKTLVTNKPTSLDNWIMTDMFEIQEKKIESDNWWDANGSYPYKATLTVIGQPKALSPGRSVISVNPVIRGQSHHTAGKYKILTVTDNVSSQGFTTTYTGYKMKSTDLIHGNTVDTGTYVYEDGALKSVDEINFQKDSDYIDSRVVVGNVQGAKGVRTGTKYPFNWPVQGHFGISSYYRTASRPNHNGIDISDAGINGAPIIAIYDGTVTAVKRGWSAKTDGKQGMASYGNYCDINHGPILNIGVFSSRYAHATSINVVKGQKVKKGDIIGYVGSTGNSTGPHLHFEIRRNNQLQNPVDYLPTK